VCRISVCSPQHIQSLCCHIVGKGSRLRGVWPQSAWRHQMTHLPWQNEEYTPALFLYIVLRARWGIPAPSACLSYFRAGRCMVLGTVSINEILGFGMHFYVDFLFCTEMAWFCFVDACELLWSHESRWEYCTQCTS